MGRSEDSAMSFEGGVAAVGLLVTLAFGAWWTGLAVADGKIWWTVVRFGLSVIGGMYYLALYRIARGGIALRRQRF